MKHRIAVALIAILAAFVAFPAAASAHIRAIDHGGTYWGDVSVEPNQVVDGDVDVLFGDARIEGRVNGNVNVFGGAIDATSGSVVTGQKHVVGGGFAESIAPWIPAGVAAENSRMLALLAYSAIVVLMFLIFPVRVRVALDRVEQHPALSGAVGIVAVVAVVPVAIILLFTVILWPLIPLEFIGVIVGVFIGQAALGLLVG
ncbi:MAG: hypothetical protein M3R35_04660, partial [Candidatus Eremiobacteraeota bacterium]|nr:hypothetical protein [Candidatus Eremiobacteraeota bacterium]